MDAWGGPVSEQDLALLVVTVQFKPALLNMPFSAPKQLVVTALEVPLETAVCGSKEVGEMNQLTTGEAQFCYFS